MINTIENSVEWVNSKEYLYANQQSLGRHVAENMSRSRNYHGTIFRYGRGREHRHPNCRTTACDQPLERHVR